jgi:hypothetical protein
MFAQAVYLMFAAVYVCKETVEHILLGMGEGEGHHHHAAEDVFGSGYAFFFPIENVNFYLIVLLPPVLISLSL